MLISRTHGFLYIHIPKTGGTSLTVALSRHAGWKARLAFEGGATPGLRRLISMAAGGRDHVRWLTGFDAHDSYATIRHVLGPSVDDLFSFAVTRNPFARAISLYQHFRRVPTHPHFRRAQVQTFAELMPLLLKEEWFQQGQLVGHLPSRKVSVNMLLAFERLDQDIAALEKALGLPRPLSLPHLNAAPEADPDIAAMFGGAEHEFAQALADDFSMLGYSTDLADAHLPPQRP